MVAQWMDVIRWKIEAVLVRVSRRKAETEMAETLRLCGAQAGWAHGNARLCSVDAALRSRGAVAQQSV